MTNQNRYIVKLFLYVKTRLRYFRPHTQIPHTPCQSFVYSFGHYSMGRIAQSYQMQNISFKLDRCQFCLQEKGVACTMEYVTHKKSRESALRVTCKNTHWLCVLHRQLYHVTHTDIASTVKDLQTKGNHFLITCSTRCRGEFQAWHSSYQISKKKNL